MSSTCFEPEGPSSGRRLHVQSWYNFVFFLLGDSPASEFYVRKFRNTLSVPYSSMKVELTGCSETSLPKIQTLGNQPKERKQHSEHDESWYLYHGIICLHSKCIRLLVPLECQHIIP